MVHGLLLKRKLAREVSFNEGARYCASVNGTLSNNQVNIKIGRLSVYITVLYSRNDLAYFPGLVFEIVA